MWSFCLSLEPIEWIHLLCPSVVCFKLIGPTEMTSLFHSCCAFVDGVGWGAARNEPQQPRLHHRNQNVLQINPREWVAVVCRHTTPLPGISGPEFPSYLFDSWCLKHSLSKDVHLAHTGYIVAIPTCSPPLSITANCLTNYARNISLITICVSLPECQLHKNKNFV